MRRYLAMAIVGLLVACQQGGAKSADAYVSEYGGSVAVYEGILADTDCTSLQAGFDQASTNNEAAPAGSEQASWTRGYMAAADDRMRVVGCYK